MNTVENIWKSEACARGYESCNECPQTWKSDKSEYVCNCRCHTRTPAGAAAKAKAAKG